MTDYVALLMALIVIAASLAYVYYIIKGKVEPTKSTWIIFTILLGMNVISFFSAKIDWVSGIYGIADFFNVILITMATFIHSRKKVVFKEFEKYYLIGIACCVLFWIITGSPFKTNLFVQSLMTVGYIATVHNIILAKETTEPKLCWSIWTIGSLPALYLAIGKNNTLSIIYATRSLFMCFSIFILTFKFQKK